MGVRDDLLAAADELETTLGLPPERLTAEVRAVINRVAGTPDEAVAELRAEAEKN